MKSVGQLSAIWIGMVNRYAVWVTIVFFGATYFLADYAANNLGINTSTADMVAEHLPWRQDFIEYREAFPEVQNNLIAVLDGANGEIVDSAIKQLVQELSATELFESIYAPVSNEFFDTHGLLYLSVEELETFADQVTTYQPVLASLARNQTVTGFFDLLTQAVEQDRSADLELMTVPLTEVLEAANNDQFHLLSWRRLMGGSSEFDLGDRRFLILKPKLNFSTLQPARTAIEAVRNSAVATQPEVLVRLTGSVALEFEELQSVTRGVKLAGVLALVLVAVLLYLALRSGWLILASLIALISGLIGTAAFAAAVFGSLNLISVAFAVLYIGLGIDFAIHFCLRYRELRAQNHRCGEALQSTGRGVGASLVFCAVTTAAGFFSFFPTEFAGVSELGVISGVGMFISLAVTLTFLPALLSLTPNLAFTPLGGPPFTALSSTGGGRIVIVGTIVAALLSLVLIPQVRFDSDPLNLRDPESESVATFTELLEESENSPLTLVAIMDDDAIDSAKERLKTLPTVAKVISLRDFIPASQEQKLALIEDLGWVLGPQPQSLADTETVADVITALDRFVAQANNGSASGGLSNVLEPLNQWRKRLVQPAGEEAIADLQARLFTTLPVNIQQLWRSTEAAAVSRETLPEDLKRRWLTQDGRQRLEIFANLNLRDAENARRFIAEVREAVPQATGIPIVNQEAGLVISRSFKIAFVYAAIAVFLLLMFWLRSLFDSIVVILPVALAGLLTMAVMVLFGMPLNYANIIALPLLLGIGVDNGIHIVHRFRIGGEQLMSTSTARAVFFSTLTTVASFGNLAFSPHLGTASMGTLLTAGMLMILFTTLIFLPAVLIARQAIK